jgi:hypothetical protein
MGKKSGSSQPATPDPYETAAAQGALNKETAQEQARLNRLNETTPYGSVSYQNTGNADVPYQRTTTLDPAEQALLNSQRNQELKLSDLGGTILDRVAPDLATPFNLDGLPAAPVANDETRQRVESALMARMQPQLDNDRESLRTRLSNTGFDMNSEGYRSALDENTRAVNDARYGAIAQGGQEQSRLFGLEQAGRQQAITEEAMKRSQPLNEIAAILGTGQVSTPNFGGVPQVGVAAPDLQGAVQNQYAQQMNQYNQAQSKKGSSMGGLFGLAGSLGSAAIANPAIFASDRRLKTAIKRVGDWLGYPMYSFRYLWGEHGIGVMSDEVNQDAVLKTSSGFDLVDYARIA